VRILNGKGLVGFVRVSVVMIILFAFAIFFSSYVGVISAQSASIWTTDVFGNSQYDFPPFTTVYIHGSEFLPDSGIGVYVTNPYMITDYGSSTSDQHGTFIYEYELIDGIEGLYTVSATDGTNIVETTFTDGTNPSANLDQCKNGGVGDPIISPCDWVNGNLNSNQAHYKEGDSVPYRITLANIPVSGTANCTSTGSLDCELVIGYDIKHNSKNALDYLTYFDRIAEDVDPCDGVSPCTFGNQFTVPVPNGTPQPQDSFSSLLPIEKLITIYNGNIVNVSYDSHGDLGVSQSETVVRIKFRATDSNVVVSWGGHIASRLDWGYGNSAGGISGSPYHMRLKDLCTPELDKSDNVVLDCAGGNQDRSLSAQAVSPPPTGKISGYKWDDSNNNGVIDMGEPYLSGWNITISGPNNVSTFNVTNGSGYYEFNDLYNGTYTLSEILQSGWVQTYPPIGNHAVDLVCALGDCTNVTDVNFGNMLAGCFDDSDCNDANTCTQEACIDHSCVYTPEPLSTPCEADGDQCTIDHCDGAGTCTTFDNVYVPDPEQCAEHNRPL
jgi:hypothetical protein